MASTPFRGTPPQPAPSWDPALRDLLKRYPASTLEAARRLRAGDRTSETMRIFVLGVIARHLPHQIHAQLRLGDDHLRLAADLGLDSLSLLEMTIVLEEVMGFTVPQETLRRLRTVGDVVELIGGNGTLTSHHSPSDDQPDAA